MAGNPRSTIQPLPPISNIAKVCKNSSEEDATYKVIDLSRSEDDGCTNFGSIVSVAKYFVQIAPIGAVDPFTEAIA
jgi:hypothetical protein